MGGSIAVVILILFGRQRHTRGEGGVGCPRVGAKSMLKMVNVTAY